MTTKDLAHAVKIVLANTYTLYLKTQNYHWHVKGTHFRSLHLLFEEQYQALANAVDEIAERLLAMNEFAPATFKEFLELTEIQEGDYKKNAHDMVKDLEKDQDIMIASINKAIKLAQDHHDEGTVTIFGERVAAHEKARWMLLSSL